MGQKYGCEPEGLLPLCPKGRSGLAAKEKGGIINTAYRENPRLAGLSDSCVSEDGVIIFTKVLAAELGPSGIGVNCIAPGLTVTKFSETPWRSPQIRKQVEKIASLYHLGETHRILGAAIFLAPESHRIGRRGNTSHLWGHVGLSLKMIGRIFISWGQGPG